MKDTIHELFKQYARTASFVLFAWASIGPVASITARLHKEQDQPFITVRIYDYARVGRTRLGEAERQAAGIFALAGLRIVWTEYPLIPRTVSAQPEDSEADFFVRILPASMARRCNYTAGTLGESVISPTAEGSLPGGTANVFYDQVDHISYLWHLDPGEILGDAMAHELGHLLLGADHSTQGIMKAPWSVEDIELAKRGHLRFLPAETTALQHAVRSLPRNSSTMLSVLR